MSDDERYKNLVRAADPPHLDPEYGDVRAVERTFGLKESHTYELWNRGAIKGVLVPGPRGKNRGKRLFDFRSIRAYLAECEKNGPKRSPSNPGKQYPRPKRTEPEQQQKVTV